MLSMRLYVATRLLRIRAAFLSTGTADVVKVWLMRVILLFAVRCAGKEPSEIIKIWKYLQE
jgi:hypothetical protein